MFTVLVGTYEKAGGRGLVPLEVARDGTLTPGEPFASAPNASFGVRGHGLIYLVDEQQQGGLTVLRTERGRLERVARLGTQGGAPCYLALDRQGTRLAVANYETGSVALFALDGRGLPIDPPALFRSRGKGPVADRQEGPHAHCVRFSHGGEALYLVDLGADTVWCLRLGMGAVFLDADEVWRAPPGTGPRHLCFHPTRPLVLVLSELASTLTLLHGRDGKLFPYQTISTLPPGFSGESLGGHLALNAAGTRVYVSNRGHDSIAVFALENDHLEPLQHVASGGAHPRHFALCEKEGRVAVAHERDSQVALLSLVTDGTLTETGKAVQVPGACFLLA